MMTQKELKNLLALQGNNFHINDPHRMKFYLKRSIQEVLSSVTTHRPTIVAYIEKMILRDECNHTFYLFMHISPEFSNASFLNNEFSQEYTIASQALDYKELHGKNLNAILELFEIMTYRKMHSFAKKFLKSLHQKFSSYIDDQTDRIYKFDMNTLNEIYNEDECLTIDIIDKKFSK